MSMVELIGRKLLNNKRKNINLSNYPRIYTGIGARNPRDSVKDIIKNIASFLAKKNYILYSGGAPGCQTVFEKGCDEYRGMKNIFLPWKGYNNSSSPLVSWGRKITPLISPLSDTILENMSPEIKYIHLRNIQLLFGYNLDKPSKFVICWFPYVSYDYSMLIHYAEYFDIPVFNIFNATDFSYVHYILEELVGESNDGKRDL